MPLIAGASIGYTGVVYALDKAWYAQQSRGRFRFYNDWLEWQQMDKFGHSMTAYYENAISYKLFRWTGMNKKNALISGAISASVLQTTIEVMDGFVTTYGFSWWDMAFNSLGVGIFTIQEALLDKQPLKLKFSASLQNYSNEPLSAINSEQKTTLLQRAEMLYGNTFFERLLKDYNGQTYWLSIFPAQFNKNTDSHWPAFLGFSIGYTSANMFGGYSNTWSDNTGNSFEAPVERYRQILLSMDIDLTAIPVRSHFIKSLFSALNFIKIPFPAFGYTTQGRWVGYGLYF
jgi:hypothetical protein